MNGSLAKLLLAFNGVLMAAVISLVSLTWNDLKTDVQESQAEIRAIKERYGQINLIEYRLGVVEQKIDLLLER